MMMKLFRTNNFIIIDTSAAAVSYLYDKHMILKHVTVEGIGRGMLALQRMAPLPPKIVKLAGAEFPDSPACAYFFLHILKGP